ncbi:MAG: DNA-processing protein DprA [Ignavibacteria bacterium]|nr:DNA-processing protein DprA [Ignavibacteria bacterium]
MWSKSDILALCISKIANQQKLKQIVENFETFDNFLKFVSQNESSQLLPEMVGSFDKLLFAKDESERQFSKAEHLGVSIITFWDEDYPKLLREIQYPPLVLFVMGDIDPTAKSISIVGTRNCTTYGKLTTENFAEKIASRGIVITSGLAYGVDTLAHLSAIKVNGRTYGVLASGLDCITSSITRKIVDKIVESGGAVITEHKFGVKALPIYFPQRNRIISGISLATVVIESDIKGGAMITARFSFDQNRYVYAIPGNINSPKSRGTNYLIKTDIAKLVASPEEILLDLGLISDTFEFDGQEKPVALEDEVDTKIVNSLTLEPKHIDIIADEVQIEISELLFRLLNLEFQGFVKQLPGKFYIKG